MSLLLSSVSLSCRVPWSMALMLARLPPAAHHDDDPQQKPGVVKHFPNHVGISSCCSHESDRTRTVSHYQDYAELVHWSGAFLCSVPRMR
ncbi:hypothetical protein QBC47DRAFT_61738 [Echria macrotheca]|uniref:Secreted protein n=1 Tax=Echria macrotheca TaxID=438768 RepID=A0AAJ0B6P0_9PEZI|nr:hypothetical protein QBC47DRAFT_61738 [Echria macrotheca]